MHRREFQTLAAIRLTEAKRLLDSGMFDGAYYLSGYAVECALKACIARKTRLHEFPPRPNLVRGMYTHDLDDLVRIAGLSLSLAARIQACSTFDANWARVQDWSEESRYERWSADQASGLYNAITDRQHGVLRWVRDYW